MKTFLFLCLITAMLANQINYPGARARIQEKLINQGYNHYSGMITDVVAGQVADLQDVSITKGSLLWKVTLTFHTLTINKIDFTAANSVQVDIKSDNTVAFAVTNIPLAVKIAYDLKYIFDKDAETIDVTATISSLNFVIKVVKDDQGQLSFQLTTLSGKVGNLDYDVHGADILVKAINFLGKSIFKGLIEDAINDSWGDIKDAIQPELDLAADLLKQYYTLQIPNSNFVLDLHVINLSSEPDQINFALNGTVFNSLHPTHIPPFTPSSMIDYQTDYPVSVQLSDYTTNSFLFTIYDMGILMLDVTSDMMPSTSPLKLDTTSLNIYFPGLVDTFGTQNVSLHCEINDVPQSNFKDSIMTGELQAFIDWKVNSTSGFVLAFTQLLTIDVNLNVTIKTNSTGTYLQVYLGSLSFSQIDYQNVHEGLNLDSAVSMQQFNILAMFTAQIFNGEDVWFYLPIPDFILIQDSKILFQEGSIEAGALPKWYIQQLFAALNA